MDKTPHGQEITPTPILLYVDMFLSMDNAKYKIVQRTMQVFLSTYTKTDVGVMSVGCSVLHSIITNGLIIVNYFHIGGHKNLIK